MSKSLVNDLGAGYVSDFFLNALFMHNDTIYKFRGIDEARGVANVHKLDTTDAPQFVAAKMKLDVFEDFGTFAYPKLGYRQLKNRHFKGDKIIAYLSTQRSTNRGLREDTITYTYPTVYMAMDFNNYGLHNGTNTAERILEIFKPTFTTFNAGIKEMLEGKSLGFVLNEDMAVVMSVEQGADKFASVLYRGRVVGQVSSSGNVEITNKVLQRNSIKNKLFN